MAVIPGPPHSSEDTSFPPDDQVLKSLQLRPVPFIVARGLAVRHHYLRSMPGGTQLCLGAFAGSHLLGAVILGVGPYLAHQLVDGASPQDCLTLTRLWLDDKLPRNSESRVIGMVTRALRQHTAVKFVISYADPSAGHVGTVYQAAGWLYTGLSEAMPLYDVGDGIARHSRSLAHAWGTHSLRYLTGHGVPVKVIRQAAKHRYLCLLDRSWRSRLRPAVLPYPKRGQP
jgi:hypothetical protein